MTHNEIDDATAWRRVGIAIGSLVALALGLIATAIVVPGFF